MPQLRVLLGFTSAPDHSLEELATNVAEKMYPNTAFPAPTVTEAALNSATTAFTNAIGAAKLFLSC